MGSLICFPPRSVFILYSIHCNGKTPDIRNQCFYIGEPASVDLVQREFNLKAELRSDLTAKKAVTPVSFLNGIAFQEHDACVIY
jgi:hypothetical protein